MSKDYLLRVLAIIILALLVYNMLFSGGSDKKYLDLIRQENKALDQKFDSLQAVITVQYDSLKAAQRTDTIIRNYYYEMAKQIDTISTDTAAISLIRQQLAKLGAARFD